MRNDYFRVYGFQKVGFVRLFDFEMCGSFGHAHRLIWNVLNDPEFAALGTVGIVFESPGCTAQFRFFAKRRSNGFEYVGGWLLGEFEHEDIAFAKPRTVRKRRGA